MRVDEFNPRFLSDRESKEYATRQLLSFLSVTEDDRKKRGPKKELFSLSKIPPEAIGNKEPFFMWTSRPIFDVDGVQLFWDQSIVLDGTNSLTVRTAASDLLRTPVWSVRAGKTRKFEKLIENAREAINDSPNLEPVLMDGENKPPRLVCYAYPKLGILAVSKADPTLRFVVDLFDRRLIPVKRKEQSDDDDPREESINRVWSPYDLVTAATIDDFRKRWYRNIDSLPRMPAAPDQIDVETAEARTKVEELDTCPVLEQTGQEIGTFCAPATMQMILRHYDVVKSQSEIATAMGTGPSGTLLAPQAEVIDDLTGFAFVGLLDDSTSFQEGKDEISANRPFKTGGKAHARACSGYMIEEIDPDTTRDWLFIFDPMPERIGDVYFESWEADYQKDYIYVRRAPPPPSE